MTETKAIVFSIICILIPFGGLLYQWIRAHRALKLENQKLRELLNIKPETILYKSEIRDGDTLIKSIQYREDMPNGKLGSS